MTERKFPSFRALLIHRARKRNVITGLFALAMSAIPVLILTTTSHPFLWDKYEFLNTIEYKELGTPDARNDYVPDPYNELFTSVGGSAPPTIRLRYNSPEGQEDPLWSFDKVQKHLEDHGMQCHPDSNTEAYGDRTTVVVCTKGDFTATLAAIAGSGKQPNAVSLMITSD